MQSRNEKVSIGDMKKMFGDIITDVTSNKKFHPVVMELYIRDQKLNISLVFIVGPCFPVSKDIRLNTAFFYQEYVNKCY